MTKLLNFKVVVEQDEDRVFVASVPSVPGCHSEGKTYEEALKNVREALELSLEVAKKLPGYEKQIVYPQDNQEKFLGIANLPIRLAI